MKSHRVLIKEIDDFPKMWEEYKAGLTPTRMESDEVRTSFHKPTLTLEMRQHGARPYMKSSLSYDERCYQLLKRVPRGRVTTYGELARALGSTAYRAVGNAMNRNSEAPKIPCHRVVRSDGSVGGYAFGPAKKIAILKKEGVAVREGKVEDFERVFYRFSKR